VVVSYLQQGLLIYHKAELKEFYESDCSQNSYD
jgi:hypothetical protein